MRTLFFVSVAVILYAYVIYPAAIALCAYLRPRRTETRHRHVPVSIVVAAHNEAANITARLENLIAQEYPRELVEILVISNGSSDRTAELARCYADQGVRVIEGPTAAGKAIALNAGVANASHDIIVFADARQRFSPNAVAELVSVLYDPEVGAVSGELVLLNQDQRSELHEGLGLYWRYEKLIRRSESAFSSVVGVTGSIYAVRRILYVPLAPHTLLDDLLIPMRIVLAGHRVSFTRAARAFDYPSPTTAKEFSRKVRTLAGNFQALAMEPLLLSPRHNPVLVQFVSHKLVRLVVPYCCVAAWVTSALLEGTLFAAAFAVQTLFYGMGILNLTPLRTARIAGLFRVSWAFIVLNAAAVAGFWVFVTRQEHMVWRKT